MILIKLHFGFRKSMVLNFKDLFSRNSRFTKCFFVRFFFFFAKCYFYKSQPNLLILLTLCASVPFNKLLFGFFCFVLLHSIATVITRAGVRRSSSVHPSFVPKTRFLGNRLRNKCHFFLGGGMHVHHISRPLLFIF